MIRICLSILLAAGAAVAEELPITGVACAVFRSSDLEKSRGFYRGVLGYHEYDVQASGRMEVAFFKVNDEQYVAILPNLEPGSAARFDHVVFGTTDLNRLRGVLAARGLNPTEPATAPDGSRACFVRDPEGNKLAFMQLTRNSIENGMRGKYSEGRISEHLYHVGLMVSNLDQALEFYGRKLGFTEFWRDGPTPDRPIWFNLRPPGGRGDYIELMLYSGDLDREQRGAMQHIALEVPDIHAALKTAVERGHFDEKKLDMRIGRNRKWQLNLFDPDGTRAELMEPRTQPQ